MNPIAITAGLLVLTAVLSYTEIGQRFIEKITGGLIKRAVVPWVGLLATFVWTLLVFPNPNIRGFVFGAYLVGIAATLNWWAPRNPHVRGIIQNAFLGGQDIWSQSNYKLYTGMLWGAAIALLIPWGGTAVNFGGMFIAIGWIIWQSYKGHSENNKTKPEVANVTGQV